VPLEGHWQRVNTPLRRLTGRERLAALVAAAVSAIAVLALVLATVGDSQPDRTSPGCIYAIVPGVMGAEPRQACGADARTICNEYRVNTRPGSPAVLESCRRAGIL
jgi:hypothetical protein